MQPNYRRCISCRKIAPKQTFWRIVRVHSSRQVQLDKGMGRSAYICPHESCLYNASKKNRLGKVLRTNIPDNIYRTLWNRWHRLNNAESISTKPPNS
ncbi:YlxR family protein [Cyanobacterium sp. uoEpiScrs1]|uniref:YlxR family protein n=1 Tax=Cyanobacterium sp. uoEpiScrs1 TaxID=2976343 RepID=UPI00226ACFCC|nr:YlxR family protein [Cyanobacterium sp. uoEpiScrs1]